MTAVFKLHVLCALVLVILTCFLHLGSPCLSTRLRQKVKKTYDRKKYTKKGQCVDIVPPKGDLCRNLSYNTTFFPNILKYKSQRDGNIELNMFSPMIKLNCSPDAEEFLCSTFFPECSSKGRMVLPCRSLCQSVRDGCEPLLLQHAFEWPPAFDCKWFPENSKCFKGHRRAPEETTATTRPALKTTPPETEQTTNLREARMTNESSLEVGRVDSVEDDDEDAENETDATAEGPCECAKDYDNDQERDQPTNCVQGHYDCRNADTKSYLNGTPFCCFHGKQIVHTATSGSDGELITSCKCSYATPSSPDQC